MAVSFLRSRFLQRTAPYLQPKRHSGYIILLPEIGDEVMEKNPFLGENGFPTFKSFSNEKCLATMGKQAMEFEKGVSNIEKKVSTGSHDIFQDIIEPLEELEAPLEITWGVAKSLSLCNNKLMPTSTYLHIHDRAARARMTKFYSLPIYTLAMEAKKDTTSYSEEQYRLLDKFILEGKLNGLELDEYKRDRLNYVLHDLQHERKYYRLKVDYSNQNFSTAINDPNIIREFPDSLLRAMSEDKNDPGKGPWKASFHPSIYKRFLKYCPDKLHRWNLWQAHERRASAHLDNELDNSRHLEQIRNNRDEQAKILGYKTFAEMSMESKMAGSVENLKEFIQTLYEKARPAQNADLASLQAFALERGFSGKLEHCDIDYWQRKQLKTLYNFEDEELRDYFSLPVVLNGLFQLCSKLFNIRIEERTDIETWHDDVKFYDVFEGQDNQLVAGFYFDPYNRDEKIPILGETGWMSSIRNRSLVTDSEPLATLIFNFQKPIYGKPTLLSFTELTGLFHRVGHSLRHLLTRARYTEVAGVCNVEWDASDVGGCFMSEWLYNPEYLKSISRHYANDEQLPDGVLENLQNVRKHMAGYDLCMELYLCELDLELHHTDDYWRPLTQRVWKKYHSIPMDKQDSHPCSFMKIFVDSWGAAYYCQLWSRMLAADIYSAFTEVGNNERELSNVGKRYRETFLALGGGCHPSEVFRRFMGRDPSPKALLQTLGLENETKNRLTLS